LACIAIFLPFEIWIGEIQVVFVEAAFECSQQYDIIFEEMEG
jgi:hypothetical protein